MNVIPLWWTQFMSKMQTSCLGWNIIWKIRMTQNKKNVPPWWWPYICSIIIHYSILPSWTLYHIMCQQIKSKQLTGLYYCTVPAPWLWELTGGSTSYISVVREMRCRQYLMMCLVIKIMMIKWTLVSISTADIIIWRQLLRENVWCTMIVNEILFLKNSCK